MYIGTRVHMRFDDVVDGMTKCVKPLRQLETSSTK